MTTWLIGIDNPHSTDPDKALEPHHGAGRRLFELSGMTLLEYLAAFRRVNAVDNPSPAPGDTVLVLGRLAWDRLRIKRKVHLFEELERGGVRYVFLPHPSGRNRNLNCPLIRERVRSVLRRSAYGHSGTSESSVRGSTETTSWGAATSS